MKTQRETPDNICEKLIKSASLEDGHSILEPSAGEGKIVKFILSQNSTLKITAVELNKEKCDSLLNINSIEKVIHGNFLKLEFEKKYDRIIACPPFKGNVDIEHITKMYDLLNEGGVISTLTSPYWVTNNEEHQVKFRNWLSDKKYSMVLIPDNSFIENNKSVPTALLVIKK